MGGRPKSTFKSPLWEKTIFPIVSCSLPWKKLFLRDCCSVLCNNKALNFVITRASPWNNRFTPVVITRAILLLHGLCIVLYQNCLGSQKTKTLWFMSKWSIDEIELSLNSTQWIWNASPRTPNQSYPWRSIIRFTSIWGLKGRRTC